MVEIKGKELVFLLLKIFNTTEVFNLPQKVEIWQIKKHGEIKQSLSKQYFFNLKNRDSTVSRKIAPIFQEIISEFHPEIKVKNDEGMYWQSRRNKQKNEVREQNTNNQLKEDFIFRFLGCSENAIVNIHQMNRSYLSGFENEKI